MGRGSTSAFFLLKSMVTCKLWYYVNVLKRRVDAGKKTVITVNLLAVFSGTSHPWKNSSTSCYRPFHWDCLQKSYHPDEPSGCKCTLEDFPIPTFNCQPLHKSNPCHHFTSFPPPPGKKQQQNTNINSLRCTLTPNYKPHGCFQK